MFLQKISKLPTVFRIIFVILFMAVYTIAILYTIPWFKSQLTHSLGLHRDIPQLVKKLSNTMSRPIGLLTKPSFIGHEESESFLLNQNYSSISVFYVWCGSRWFQFSHYLSVLSVQRHLRPDNIIFYYEKAPVVDKQVYHTWFNELKDNFPFFEERQLKRSDHACLINNQANIAFIIKLINRRGRIYINESTILSDSIHILHDDLALGENNGGTVALMMSRKGYHEKGFKKALRANNKTTRFSCVSREHYGNSTAAAVRCVTLNSTLYPKDIWELDDQFGRFIRTLFYGGPEVRLATPSYDTLVPNIAHMIWIGGGEMDFLFYLGVLSLVYVAKVDMVYIHGDAPPKGRYWDLVKNHTQIQLIYRESSKVYGISVKHPMYQSDFWRVDLMIKYGGIYMDTDAVFVRPLDQKIRGYDAVGTLGFPKSYHPFPNILMSGVLIGKKNAPFWHEYMKAMKNFRNNVLCFNGCKQPYKIHERQPNLIKLEPHFQVECYQGKCHPTWWPDYQNINVHHLNSPSIKNWKKDAYAFHWTGDYPQELLNPSNLLKSKSMFSEIGQHILQQAGMIKYFKKEHLNYRPSL